MGSRDELNIEFILVNVRGLFRDLVLYAVAKLGKAHGYAIKKFISQTIKVYVPSSGVLYPTLHELERDGLLRSEKEEKRKVYELTEKGLEYLKMRMNVIEKTIKKLNRTVELLSYVGLNDLFEVIKRLWELEIEPPQSVLDAIRARVMEIRDMLNSLIKEYTYSATPSNTVTKNV